MKMNRKKFIILSSLGIASLTGMWLGFFANPFGIRREDLPEDAKTQKLKNKIGEERVHILYLASLAVSPHNSQPWTVKIINKDRWIIGADPFRHMKSTDPLRHELMIAIGAFIENLTIAAGAAGFEAQIRIIAENFYSNDIAEVTLKKRVAQPYPLERLTCRKTMKKNFLEKELSDDHIEKLSDPLRGHFFYYPRGTRHADCIRDEAIKAFQSWLDSVEAQQEHVSWIRMTNNAAKKKRDGLTTAGMGIHGILGWFARTFISERDWAGDFLRNESIKYTRTTTPEGSGFIIITAYGNDVAGIIETGRRFERMALLARECSIGIHPMTQMLEMESGLDVIKSSHRKRILPKLILRIGYVRNYTPPVSLRRPVGWFVS